MTHSPFNSRLTRIALCTLGIILLGAPRLAQAQDEATGRSCKCGESAECTEGTNPPVPITNLDDKTQDLVLCATDAEPEQCEAIWKNKAVTKRVSSVQDAVNEINAMFTQLGRKLNVVVDGHGHSGVQCFGPDTTGSNPDLECIGNNTAKLIANKDLFVNGDPPNKTGAKDKIKDLILLGCSAAQDTKGQNFLEKLRDDLLANSVKGWTGTIWARARSEAGSVPTTTCGNAPACNGACPVGQICVEAVLDDETVECWCGNFVPKAGGYDSEGGKKVDGVPAAKCDGAESTGSGMSSCDEVARDYAYIVADPSGSLTDFSVGTHDAGMKNYSNWCMPPGWTVTIEPNTIKLRHGPSKIPHGKYSPDSGGSCPAVVHFSGPAGLPAGEWRFGFDNPQPSHDVGWQLVDFVDISRADWSEAVGTGVGPVHGPSIDIPAVTEWGLVVMALLVVAAGTVVIRRARVVAA